MAIGRFVVACAVVPALALALTLDGRAQRGSPAPVVSLDPSFSAVVSPRATVDLLEGDNFGLLEGPLWIDEGTSGYLLFSDMAANVIYKRLPNGARSVFLEKSGFSGQSVEHINVVSNGRFGVIGLPGSNALTLDPQGRLVFNQHGDRAVVRLERDGTRTVVADRFEGKRFNSPNDIVTRSDGSFYFTDPRSGLRGGINSPVNELPFTGLFRVKDGTVQLLDKDPGGGLTGSPNGLAFSPGEKHLYVSAAGRRIMRYSVPADGTVTAPEVFVDMSADQTPGGIDGMKVDREGNVYSTGPGGVWVMAPSGKHIGTIRLPGAFRDPVDPGETGVNLAFGDRDRKSLYIVTRRSVYRVRVLVPGLAPEGRPGERLMSP